VTNISQRSYQHSSPLEEDFDYLQRSPASFNTRAFESSSHRDCFKFRWRTSSTSCSRDDEVFFHPSDSSTEEKNQEAAFENHPKHLPPIFPRSEAVAIRFLSHAFCSLALFTAEVLPFVAVRVFARGPASLGLAVCAKACKGERLPTGRGFAVCESILGWVIVAKRR
jgi:hypothetical protein